MERFTLQEARESLGKIVSRVIHGDQHIEITRYGTDPVVVISKADYDEYRRLREQETRRLIEEGSAAIARGEIPPGTSRLTREDLAKDDEAWLA